MHGMQESVRQEVQKAREEHRLDVGDQLSLSHQTVQSRRLLKALKREEQYFGNYINFLN